MLLTYVDDSGNSWEVINGFFKDGSHVLHVGILVNEEKYFHLERMFYDLFSSMLGIKDWKSVELHASDIWNKKGSFSHLSDVIIRRYFAEFLQMLAKFSIKVVVGVQQKKKKLRTKKSQDHLIKNSQYAFLHVLEHALAQQNETTVIISDEGDKINNLSELLYKRSQWRYNPGADRRKATRLPGFKYETLSCFTLDQMHTVSSKDSFFIQIVDHVAYIFNRVLTYSYLKTFPTSGPSADIKMVPVGINDFRFFSKDITVAEYRDSEKDVVFTDLDVYLNTVSRVVNDDEYLSGSWVRDSSPFH